MSKFEGVTKESIQELSQRQRTLSKQKERNSGLYEIILNNIISMASHGYTQYIHPVDRDLWRDDEIKFTKWKLTSHDGFSIDHRGSPASWEKILSRIFGRPYEYFVISWNWEDDKDKKKHYQWE